MSLNSSAKVVPAFLQLIEHQLCFAVCDKGNEFLLEKGRCKNYKIKVVRINEIKDQQESGQLL